MEGWSDLLSQSSTEKAFFISCNLEKAFFISCNGEMSALNIKKSWPVLFCAFYLSVHLLVGIIGIRSWPFTDYPMFGRAHGPKEVVIFHYYGISSTGHRTPIERIRSSSLGMTDYQLLRALKLKKYRKAHRAILQASQSDPILMSKKFQVIEVEKHFVVLDADNVAEPQREVVMRVFTGESY